MTADNVSTAARAQQATWGATLSAFGIAAVASVVVNTVIAMAAHGLGAGAGFMPLMPPVYSAYTIVGTLLGAIGWRIILRRSADPAALLRKLVPTVLLLSFIPDLLVLITKALPETSATGVLALMLMHVAVTVIAVPAYRKFMPPA